MKLAIHIETTIIGRYTCPHCSKKNFIRTDGDVSDPSKMDPEVMICWYCKKESSLIDLEEFYPGENHDEISLETTEGEATA